MVCLPMLRKAESANEINNIKLVLYNHYERFDLWKGGCYG